jgi:transcriptional regulatory protein LEU3
VDNIIRTHDDLRERSRQQDAQIQSLLDQFDQLHMDAKVAKWVQHAQQLARLDNEENIGMNSSYISVSMDTFWKLISDCPLARPVAPVTCHYYSSLIGPLYVDLSRKHYIPELLDYIIHLLDTASNPNFMKIPMVLRAGILEPREIIDLFNLYVLYCLTI